MNIDKSLYVPPSTQQSPYVALDVRRTLPVVKVGAILDVLVASQHNRSNYTLQLGRELVQASSEKPLVVGSRQALKVVDVDPQGKLTTQVVTPKESRIAQALQLTSSLAEPLSLLVNQLAAQPRANLPAAVQHWVDRLLASIPQRTSLTQPQQLAQALRESGMFLESRLASGKVPTQDFKAQLLNLWQQLSRIQSGKKGEPLPQTYAPSNTTTAGTAQAPPVALSRPVVPQPPTAPQQGQQPQPLVATNQPPQVPTAPSRAAPGQTPPQLAATSIQLYQQVSKQNSTAITHSSRPDGATSFSDSPQSLLRAVESGLARLETQQLTSVQARENLQLLWLLELPVRNGADIDVWQFLLQREEPDGKQTTADNETHYRVSLNVELGGLGSLAIEIDYSQSETRIEFYSKSTEVLAAIRARGDELKARLNSQGIEQPGIDAHFGEGRERSQSFARPSLDTRA